MKNKLNDILVIDIESTCWEKAPPEGQVSEIIEIGVKLIEVQSGLVGPSAGLFIKPTRSSISEFCTHLTTITPSDVEDGFSFVHACQVLRSEFNSEESIWASWGDYDRLQFQRQCSREKVKYPFGRTHINIKSLFALKHKLYHEVSVEKALEILGWRFAGTPHRAKDDALNIAMIFAELLWSKS